MRRSLLGLVVALAVSAASSEARAQVPFTSVNDPFFTYYSYYLPRQQAQAMSPGPEATINAVTANRQYYAATNRNGMFDPNASGGNQFESEEFSPNSGIRKRGSGLSIQTGRFASGVHGGNLNGLGPQGYFGGGKLVPYYHDLKTGRGKNSNVSVTRARGFSGGMGSNAGLGNLGGGLPGPR
jgi:hypothetical protein